MLPSLSVGVPAVTVDRFTHVESWRDHATDGQIAIAVSDPRAGSRNRRHRANQTQLRVLRLGQSQAADWQELSRWIDNMWYRRDHHLMVTKLEAK